mmetsp:Transcript_39161/g.111036  ORF Transcript_39161/g.111036 Transcript_39161/m.111036 type:complete len:232 (+) Transcript_39161:860-1555(+)
MHTPGSAPSTCVAQQRPASPSQGSHAKFGTAIMRPPSNGLHHSLNQPSAPERARMAPETATKVHAGSASANCQDPGVIAENGEPPKPLPSAHSPNVGTQPFHATGSAMEATAKSVANCGAGPMRSARRQSMSRSASYARPRWRTTRMKGLCSGESPSCCRIVGPCPSSHWYSAKPQTKRPSVGETSDATRSTKSSAFCSQQFDTTTLTSVGCLQFRYKAYPSPVPRVFGMT